MSGFHYDLMRRSNMRLFLWDNFSVTAIIMILTFPFEIILHHAATEVGTGFV